MVGSDLGASVGFKRTGTDIMLYGKDSLGGFLREDESSIEGFFSDIDYHGIKYFHDDYDLFYTSPHDFPYWVE